VASASEAVSKGDEAARQGNLDMALYYYVQALERDDRDAEVFYRVGAIHDRRDNHALAAVAYRLAVRQDADHVGANEGLGLELLRQRKYQEAEVHLRRAAERDRERWRAHNGLGVLADLEGDHARAVDHFKTALVANPNSANVLNNLGYSLYLAGDLDAAAGVFQRATTSNPGYGFAWRNLGLVYARRGEYALAVEALTHAMERASAFNDVGYLAMLNGDYEEAEYLLQEATVLSPRYFVKAHENLARVDELRNGGVQPVSFSPDMAAAGRGLDAVP
jgi:Flp pilus assembly protein TadD